MLTWLGQGQTSHGVHLQVKLRGVAGIHGVVAAVVRTWRHFIDHQAAVLATVVNDEELNAQHPHISDLLRY